MADAFNEDEAAPFFSFLGVVPKLFVGMILILIFTEALALYSLIAGIFSTHTTTTTTGALVYLATVLEYLATKASGGCASGDQLCKYRSAGRTSLICLEHQRSVQPHTEIQLAVVTLMCLARITRCFSRVEEALNRPQIDSLPTPIVTPFASGVCWGCICDRKRKSVAKARINDR
eukprot:Gb_26533 [translate_table: standard]